jgi:hypothetical protein
MTLKLYTSIIGNRECCTWYQVQLHVSREGTITEQVKPPWVEPWRVPKCPPLASGQCEEAKVYYPTERVETSMLGISLG